VGRALMRLEKTAIGEFKLGEIRYIFNAYPRECDARGGAYA
jgi:hypothetical protein